MVVSFWRNGHEGRWPRGGRFRRKVRWAEIQCESVLDSGARFRVLGVMCYIMTFCVYLGTKSKTG